MKKEKYKLIAIPSAIGSVVIAVGMLFGVDAWYAMLNTMLICFCLVYVASHLVWVLADETIIAAMLVLGGLSLGCCGLDVLQMNWLVLAGDLFMGLILLAIGFVKYYRLAVKAK